MGQSLRDFLFAQSVRQPRRSRPPRRAINSWLEPRNFVFLVLALVLGVGGARRLWLGLRARRAIARLGDLDVTPAEIALAGGFGRPALAELFRLLAEGKTAEVRDAAGRALAGVWRRDDLIAEEEQALIRRGFTVRWLARRRYPRDLERPIACEAEFGVPFLRENPGEVGPQNLEWSARILGAKRADLESFTDWRSGEGKLSFAVHPGDFPGQGPHKLVLEARVRTAGLGDAWRIDLPKIPFQFELDPSLDPGAIATAPDASRGERFRAAISLKRGESREGENIYARLSETAALANPPVLAITGDLPCDLAHWVEIEFEASEVRLAAGRVVALAHPQGSGSARPVERPIHANDAGLTDVRLDPGRTRLRARLAPDLEMAWSSPEVRSIWPETIVTDWIEVEIVRR